MIDQLLKQDVITDSQYNELLKREPISASVHLQKFRSKTGLIDEIELLKDHLMKEEKLGYGFITWLQRVFLETCYAKTFFYHKGDHIIEPVPYHSTFLKEAVPIIAWSCEQKVMMQSQVFLLLLHKLGVHLPADAGKVFARIPSNWSPKTLYSKALTLGPIKEDWLKFNLFTIDYFQEGSSQEAGNAKVQKSFK